MYWGGRLVSAGSDVPHRLAASNDRRTEKGGSEEPPFLWPVGSVPAYAITKKSAFVSDVPALTVANKVCSPAPLPSAS